MRGLSTVLITVSPEASAQAGPPRAIYPLGFQIGHSLGGAGQTDLQRQVLHDALQRLVMPLEPGTIEERSYPAYVPSEHAGSSEC